MKKLALVYVAFSLALLPGCGKKDKNASKNQVKKKSVLKRLFSQSESGFDMNKKLPIYTAENEAVVDDDVVSEFSFVDESDVGEEVKNVSVASNEGLDKETKEVVEEASKFKEEKSEELLASSDMEDVESFDFERVQFDFNKNSIDKGQLEVVENDIAKAKKAVESGKDVVISGHTCQMGSAAYNLALSQKRAEAVKKEMVNAGLPEDKIKTVGYGYESPLVWTDKTDREAKIKELAPNRRVEVSIK